MYGADGAVHGTIRTVNTTNAAALKNTTHPKTRCRKPHAATQHLMILMMGACTGTCRAKNTLIKLPCCIKLVLQINSPTCEASLMFFYKWHCRFKDISLRIYPNKVYHFLTIVELQSLFEIFPRISWELLTESLGSAEQCGVSGSCDVRECANLNRKSNTAANTHKSM